MFNIGIVKVGEVKKYIPVKLIAGMISQDINLFSKASLILAKKFGAIDFKSQILDFGHTTYYQKEMGSNLKRQFISFKKLINPQKIADIKNYTNKIEMKFSTSSNMPQRRINIDPGYVCGLKLILATTKDSSHRIYLKSGIFAEVTLSFYDKTFHPWGWTYPDYKTQAYIDIFNEIRKIYTEQLKTNPL